MLDLTEVKIVPLSGPLAHEDGRVEFVATVEHRTADLGKTGVTVYCAVFRGDSAHECGWDCAKRLIFATYVTCAEAHEHGDVCPKSACCRELEEALKWIEGRLAARAAPKAKVSKKAKPEEL